MAKTSSTPTLPPHPLRTFREIADMTRQHCAIVADLTSSTVQNIELGKAMLQLDNAELLEAYTGVSATQLLALQRLWSNGTLTKKQAEIRTVDNKTFSAKSYAAYKANPVSDEAKRLAIEDIKTRIDLLLGGFGDRHHDFRAAYRRMVQFSLSERERSGLTEADIAESGRRHAEVESRVMTVQQLAKEKTVGTNQVFTDQIAKNYSPSTKVQVSIERFPSWPFPPKLQGLWLMLNPLAQTGKRTLWRMNFPDKKQYVIYTDSIQRTGFESTSLDVEFHRAFDESGSLSRDEIKRLGQMRANLNQLKPSKRKPEADKS
jgi:transcriptional regulator with XRE-family HTH domain